MDKGITGLVLAGGRGSRMGGRDKGLVLHHGEPLVAHALRRLAPQVDSVLISANRNLDRYAAFGHPVLSDDAHLERVDFAGPLAGLAAGLAACNTEWLASVPCDAPAFPLDLVARLREAADLPMLAIAATGSAASGRRQPVFCVVNRWLLPGLRAFLADGGRRVGDWCRQQNAAVVAFDDEAAFANANTELGLRDLPPT